MVVFFFCFVCFLLNNFLFFFLCWLYLRFSHLFSGLSNFLIRFAHNKQLRSKCDHSFFDTTIRSWLVLDDWNKNKLIFLLFLLWNFRFFLTEKNKGQKLKKIFQTTISIGVFDRNESVQVGWRHAYISIALKVYRGTARRSEMEKRKKNMKKIHFSKFFSGKTKTRSELFVIPTNTWWTLCLFRAWSNLNFSRVQSEQSKSIERRLSPKRCNQ